MLKPTREEFLAAVEAEFTGAIDLMRRKNQDYSPDSNGMGNLIECEILGICPAEDGILIRMTDKISRIRNLMPHRGQGAQVKDESFLDTLRDLAVYIFIYRAVVGIREKERTKGKKEWISATLSTETNKERVKREAQEKE